MNMLLWLKKVYKDYGATHVTFLAIHLLVLISLFTIEFKFFLIAVGLHIVLMPLLQTITHEYVCHEYLQPKNKIIDFFALIIFYIFNGKSVVEKRNYHITHHRYWRDPDRDPPQLKMKNVAAWQYIFNLLKPVAQNLDHINNSLLEKNSIVKLLDPHAGKIALIYTIVMFVILPWPWFVSTVIYFPWVLITLFNTHDVLFHHKNYQGQDRSIYLPLFGNQAWHLKHHNESTDNYYGPGIIPKFNLAWYYKKLFFNDSKRCLHP